MYKEKNLIYKKVFRIHFSLLTAELLQVFPRFLGDKQYQIRSKIKM